MLISNWIRKQTLVALLATCCLALHQQHVSAEDGDQFFLNHQTFKIRSSITWSKLNDSSSSKTFSYNEFYSKGSIGLGKAKIQYENAAHELEAVYYDAASKTSLIFKEESETCDTVQLSDLNNRLYFGSQPMIKFVDQMEPSQAHFIGSMRVLSYVAAKAKEMSEFETTLKNHNAVGLGLNLNPNWTIYLYYDKATFTDKVTACMSRIPMRLSLIYSSKDELLSIDFKEFSSMQSPAASTALRPGSFMVKSVDQLALPVGSDCFKFLPKVDIFGSMELDRTRLTFVAHSQDSNGQRNSKYFVAFDGLGQAMRIDAEEITKTEMSLEVTRKYLKLLDFASNKLYTIVDNPAIKYGTIHSRLEPDILRREDNKCASTFALPPAGAADSNATNQMHLSILLTGAKSFAHMGQAKIRGIDAEMYEAQMDLKSPFWLDQPVVAKDLRGKLGLRLIDNYKTKGLFFNNVVVYLTGERRKKLLALEVYDQGFSHPKMSINFYDFVWDLSDSPRGDKISNLFDHQDACLSSVDDQINQNKYAEVSMDLIANYNSNKTDWLNDMPQRQLAIGAGLRKTLDQHGFMLYDLESKITKTMDSKNLRLAFRTVQHPDTTFNLTFIGNGRARYGQGTLPLKTSAQSPVDCFWLLDQIESKQRSFYVLFYDGYCITDADPLMVSEKTLNQSRIFEVDEFCNGQIYRIDWNPNDKSDSLSTKLFRKKLNTFEGESVLLQVPQSSTDDKAEPLTFRISNIKVHGVDTVNHLLSAADDDQGTLASVFPGYALTEDQPGTWPFVPTELPANRSLSLDLCQAACLADANCKSFSYCAGWPRSTCQLSRFALNSAQVSTMLSAPEIAGLSRGSKLEVSVDGEQVSLVRDFRCELHHKLYSSLFERDLPAYVTLADQRVFKVDNEDQCAELCFGRTLDALEASDELSEQVDAELQDSGLPEQVQRSRKSHERLARDFCDRFYYLDGSLDPKQSRLVESRVDADGASANKSAYCFITNLDYDRTLPGAGRDEDLTSIFKLDVYRFDTIHLYEQKPGILILESDDITTEERKAQQAMKKEPTQAAVEILQRASEAGKNLRMSIRSEDPSACARLCLFQAAGLYPACQSFDISLTSPTLCQLNTMSLDTLQSRKADESQTQDSIATTQHAIHFEPRFGLVKRRSKLDAAQWSLPFLSYIASSKGSWTSKMSTLIVCLIAVATGLLVGSLLTERYMRRRRDRTGSASGVGFVESIVDL